MWMLSRPPYFSFEYAQNKHVVSALIDGAVVLHSSNPDAAQKPHGMGDL